MIKFVAVFDLRWIPRATGLILILLIDCGRWCRDKLMISGVFRNLIGNRIQHGRSEKKVIEVGCCKLENVFIIYARGIMG